MLHNIPVSFCVSEPRPPQRTPQISLGHMVQHGSPRRISRTSRIRANPWKRGRSLGPPPAAVRLMRSERRRHERQVISRRPTSRYLGGP